MEINLKKPTLQVMFRQIGSALQVKQLPKFSGINPTISPPRLPIHCRVRVAMSSTNLADRFAAVQEMQNKSSKEKTLMALSMEELQNLTIKFGTAKAGLTFKEVVETDPKYCQWFLRQWGASSKSEHQEFLFFLNMWTERKEFENGINCSKAGAQLPVKPQPKAGGGSWRLLHGDADRPRDRRGAVGSGVHSRIPHATQDDEPHRPARECPDASCESAAKPDTSCRSGPVRLTQPAQTLMIDHVVEEYNAYMLGLGKEKYPVQRSSVVSSNWVFCEMMQYFSQHSHNPVNSRSSLDFLEVYCSADSRLTSQCQQQGLRALRFGLKQGDLNTYEGRCQLYKVLRSSPKHIWTSPKCKAWCKWSQFNANRSLEAAQRVCQAQEDEEVHLLLCAALFKLQAMRGDEVTPFTSIWNNLSDR